MQERIAFLQILRAYLLSRGPGKGIRLTRCLLLGCHLHSPPQYFPDYERLGIALPAHCKHMDQSQRRLPSQCRRGEILDLGRLRR